MLKKIPVLFFLIMIMLIVGRAMAEEPKPIQLSLTPDMAIFDKHTKIRGVTLNIWGENPQEALALGIINGSTGTSAGLSLGFIVNYTDNYNGLLWAPVNYTKANFNGWQAGIVNCAKGPVRGLQTGIVNSAGRLTGLQFGLVNYAAKTESGVQIGLVNIIPENRFFTGLPNGLAPVMVIVNWRF